MWWRKFTDKIEIPSFSKALSHHHWVHKLDWCDHQRSWSPKSAQYTMLSRMKLVGKSQREMRSTSTAFSRLFFIRSRISFCFLAWASCTSITILTQCWYKLCPPARPPCWCRGWGQPRGRGAAWRAAAGTAGAGAGAGRAAGRGTRGCPAHGHYYHHTGGGAVPGAAVPGAAAPRRLPPRGRCVWAGAGCRGRGAAPRNFCNIGAALGGDHQLFTFI